MWNNDASSKRCTIFQKLPLFFIFFILGIRGKERDCISSQSSQNYIFHTFLTESPELRHADVLHFSSKFINNSSSYQLLGKGLTYQIAYGDLDDILSDATDKASIGLNLVETNLHLVLISPRNLTQLTAAIQTSASFTSEDQRSILFTNGYPRFRINTVVQWPSLWSNFAGERAVIERVGNSFEMHNRLNILREADDDEDGLLTEIYRINGVQIVRKLPLQFYSITNPAIYNLYNFHEAVIKATAVDSPETAPVVRYHQNGSTLTFLRGLGVSDLMDLKDMLNFTVLAMKGDKDIEGADLPLQGGIGRQLYTGEADVSILHSNIILENVIHLQPLLPLGADGVSAIFRQPPSTSVRNVFLKPFKRDVWISLVAIWTLITIFIFLFWSLLNVTNNTTPSSTFPKNIKQSNGNDESALTETDWEHAETLLWTLSVFCTRSFFRSSRSWPMRALFLTGFTLSMLTYAFYSAEIISSLMLETFPIRTLLDLIKNNFQVVANPELFFSYVFKEDWMDREEYGRKLSQTYRSDSDAISQIKEGFFRMHINTLDSFYLSSRELGLSDDQVCKTFHHIPLGNMALQSGFYVRKNSPFKQPFNHKFVGHNRPSIRIVVIMERGLNSRYIKKYYEETEIKCPKRNKTYNEDLGLNDAFSAFAVLVVGVSLSCLALFVERRILKRNKSRVYRVKLLMSNSC